MTEIRPFDFRKIFQICRVFGIWKPMCEITIITDADGIESVEERFFILRAGSVETRPVRSATQAVFEAASLSKEKGPERSPINRPYTLQFAAGKEGFRPFIKVVIEYDDAGYEKEHNCEFYVLGPDGQKHVVTGYGDAITECQRLSDELHAHKSPDGTQTPPQEDKVKGEGPSRIIRHP
jgi:hypothetical protein